MQCVSPFFCTCAAATPEKRIIKTKYKTNGTSFQLHYQPGCISHDANPLYHYRSVYRHEVRKVIEIVTLRGCRFRGIGYCDSPADQQLR